MHILIVEDTIIAQLVLKKEMIEEGCTVDIASDGHEALKKALQTHYDFILMDVGLGDGPNGFEVTTLIKQQSELNKNTPIFAVTAHGGDTYVEKAKAAGMVRYFNKPFTHVDAQFVINYVKNKSSPSL
ncbi:MAG: response regulator [Gammaproteobacteria bacterium]|nr:response regulator [Gammaproteobacteria bacterium]